MIPLIFADCFKKQTVIKLDTEKERELSITWNHHFHHFDNGFEKINMNVIKVEKSKKTHFRTF